MICSTLHIGLNLALRRTLFFSSAAPFCLYFYDVIRRPSASISCTINSSKAAGATVDRACAFLDSSSFDGSGRRRDRDSFGVGATTLYSSVRSEVLIYCCVVAVLGSMGGLLVPLLLLCGIVGICTFMRNQRRCSAICVFSRVSVVHSATIYGSGVGDFVGSSLGLQQYSSFLKKNVTCEYS